MITLDRDSGIIERDGIRIGRLRGNVVLIDHPLHHKTQARICKLARDMNLEFKREAPPEGKPLIETFEEVYNVPDPLEIGEEEPEPDRDPRLGDTDPVWMDWLRRKDPARFRLVFPPERLHQMKLTASKRFFPDVFEGKMKL